MSELRDGLRSASPFNPAVFSRLLGYPLDFRSHIGNKTYAITGVLAFDEPDLLVWF